MIIRPSFTVLTGAAIGLAAGAAVYGAVSSSATSASKPAKASVAVPAAAAQCAAGQTLEDGVCVIHIQRDVLVAAPSAGGAGLPTFARASGVSPDADDRSAASTEAGTRYGDDATEARDHDADDDATEGAEEAADRSGPDDDALEAPGDASTMAPRG